jgi:transcriptional regulator with XRE-family HTH domain
MGREPKGQEESDKLGEEIIGAIARRMIELRKKRGLTQEQLGKLVGVTQGRIFELEQRSSNITVLTLVRIAKVLDVELSELMFDIPSASEMRLADALERWTKALEERTAYEKALMEEIRPVVDEIRALAIRRQRQDDGGPGAEGTPVGREGARRPSRKTT